MSTAAITRRLEEMRQLYKLMVYLQQFKPVRSDKR
jgi:hypothetical protein